MLVWLKFLFLLSAINVASGTWVKGTGIKYYLATCGRQNCDTVCGTFGFQCARTGQSFPPTSALWIFESLGISCKSFNATDYYIFEDSPNYVAESPGNEDWVGVCLGFKSIPSTIDCHTANNTYVRRLCPCYDPSVTQQPATTSLNLSITTQRTTTTTSAATTAAPTTAAPATTATTTATTTASTTDSTTASTTASTAATTTTTTKTAATTATTTTTTTTTRGTAKPPTTTPTTRETTKSKTEATTGIGVATDEGKSTEKDIGTGLPREQATVSGNGERTALIVVAVIAAGLVVCLLSLAFLLMWKRRQLRGKRNKKQDSEKLRVGYHKNNNKMAVPDMIDGLTMVVHIEEENSYCDTISASRSLHNTKDIKVKSLAEDESSYENTFEQASENILYASVPEGTNMAFAADNNIPLYDRLAIY